MIIILALIVALVYSLYCLDQNIKDLAAWILVMMSSAYLLVLHYLPLLSGV